MSIVAPLKLLSRAAMVTACLASLLLPVCSSATTNTDPTNPGNFLIQYQVSGDTKMGTANLLDIPWDGRPDFVKQMVPWTTYTGQLSYGSGWASSPPTMTLQPGTTLTIQTSGTITLKVSWQGVGAPPKNTYLAVTGAARWASTNASGSCSGGTGGTPTSWNDPFSNGAAAPGQVVSNTKYYRLDMSSGSTTQAFSLDASTSLAAGNPIGADAEVFLSAGIASRSAAIVFVSDPTFYLNQSTMLASQNINTDTSHFMGDTAATISSLTQPIIDGQFPGGNFSLTFHDEIFGSWNPIGGFPQYGFGLSGGNGANLITSPDPTTPIATVSQDLTPDQVSSMVMGGATSFTITTTVIDPNSPGFSVDAAYTMLVHAPIEKPTLLKDTFQDTWISDSPEVDNTTLDKMTLTKSWSATTTISVNVNPQIESKLFDAIILKLGINVTLSRAVTDTEAVTMTIPVGYAGRVQAFSRKQHFIVNALMYGVQGYTGSGSVGDGWGPYSQTPEGNLIFKGEVYQIPVPE